MPRHRYKPDPHNRPRRVTTAREIRQADDIAALKAELRTLRRELAKARRPAAAPKPASPRNYDSFLDHIGAQFTAMIDKGREYYGSCPHCGNVKLPCIAPLIELERMEYEAGELDALIFAPNLYGG